MALLKDLKVSRRFALRGALAGVGVALWLPVLDAMCNSNGTAFAAGEALPTSFGIWFWGNGIHTDIWTPTVNDTDTAWTLPEALKDFAEVQDAMTLVTGLDMLSAEFKGHGWGVAYVLAGGDGNICNTMADLADLGSHQFETREQTQWEPTVDQTIADAIHTNEPFKSLETGMIPFSGDFAMGTVGDNLAHRGPGDFLAPKREPKAIFDALLEAGLPHSTGVPSDIAFKTRRSVLDAVLDEANYLKVTLGSVDAKRVDAHMQGIRELEQRLQSVDGAGTTECKAPEEPPLTFEDMTAKSHAINQLIVAALSCNLTRVYTHLWSGPRSDSLYPTLNLGGGHHAYTHASNGQEPRKIERYIMSQYADLAKLMKAAPMGAGTVLDNTLIYGVSEVSEPQSHVMKNYHIVLMGHGGGKVAGNRYVRVPGRKVTELVLTLQQVMGLNVSSWGSWDKTSRTVPEILA